MTNDAPADRLARQLGVFFELSRLLSLSAPENQALLDVPATVETRLRAEPPDTCPLDPVKLQRRLDYAIPIMQRMLASMAP